MKRKAERPASRSRRRWPRRAALGLLAILVLAAGAWAAWRYETTWPKIAAGAPKAIFVVPPGASADAIARQLHGLGLVRHPLVLRLLARERGLETQLKAGEYALSGPLSLEGILDALARGDVVRRDVTIPEGRNLDEVAALVVAQGMESTAFLEAARDPAPVRDLDPAATDLEGYLFPDTYDLPRRAPAADLVEAMVAGFRRVFDESRRERAAELGLSVRDVVTLASLIEEETALPEERPLVSAVFHNRLRLGMRLDCDPTIAYALKRGGRYTGRLLFRDLKLDSPYNTYLHAGLPPGPISSPGASSLEAALHPARVDFLYFVARGDGSHRFSRTLGEHLAAVEKYRELKNH